MASEPPGMSKWGPTCPCEVWDGPYRMTCGHVLSKDGRCVTHWSYQATAEQLAAARAGTEEGRDG